MNTTLNDDDVGRDSISSVTSNVPIHDGETAIKEPNSEAEESNDVFALEGEQLLDAMTKFESVGPAFKNLEIQLGLQLDSPTATAVSPASGNTNENTTAPQDPNPSIHVDEPNLEADNESSNNSTTSEDEEWNIAREKHRKIIAEATEFSSFAPDAPLVTPTGIEETFFENENGTHDAANSEDSDAEPAVVAPTTAIPEVKKPAPQAGKAIEETESEESNIIKEEMRAKLGVAEAAHSKEAGEIEQCKQGLERIIRIGRFGPVSVLLLESQLEGLMCFQLDQLKQDCEGKDKKIAQLEEDIARLTQELVEKNNAMELRLEEEVGGGGNNGGCEEQEKGVNDDALTVSSDDNEDHVPNQTDLGEEDGKGRTHTEQSSKKETTLSQCVMDLQSVKSTNNTKMLNDILAACGVNESEEMVFVLNKCNFCWPMLEYICSVLCGELSFDVLMGRIQEFAVLLENHMKVVSSARRRVSNDVENDYVLLPFRGSLSGVLKASEPSAVNNNDAGEDDPIAAAAQVAATKLGVKNWTECAKLSGRVKTFINFLAKLVAILRVCQQVTFEKFVKRSNRSSTLKGGIRNKMVALNKLLEDEDMAPVVAAINLLDMVKVCEGFVMPVIRGEPEKDKFTILSLREMPATVSEKARLMACLILEVMRQQLGTSEYDVEYTRAESESLVNPSYSGSAEEIDASEHSFFSNNLKAKQQASRMIADLIFATGAAQKGLSMSDEEAKIFLLALVCSPPTEYLDSKLCFLSELCKGGVEKYNQDVQEKVDKTIKRAVKGTNRKATLEEYNNSYLYVDIKSEVSMNGGSKKVYEVLASFIGSSNET